MPRERALKARVVVFGRSPPSCCRLRPCIAPAGVCTYLPPHGEAARRQRGLHGCGAAFGGQSRTRPASFHACCPLNTLHVRLASPSLQFYGDYKGDWEKHRCISRYEHGLLTLNKWVPSRGRWGERPGPARLPAAALSHARASMLGRVQSECLCPAGPGRGGEHGDEDGRRWVGREAPETPGWQAPSRAAPRTHPPRNALAVWLQVPRLPVRGVPRHADPGGAAGWVASPQAAVTRPQPYNPPTLRGNCNCLPAAPLHLSLTPPPNLPGLPAPRSHRHLPAPGCDGRAAG